MLQANRDTVHLIPSAEFRCGAMACPLNLSCLAVRSRSFLVSWAMCAGRIPRKLKTKEIQIRLSVFILFNFRVSRQQCITAVVSTVTPCIKRCLQRTENIVAPEVSINQNTRMKWK